MGTSDATLGHRVEEEGHAGHNGEGVGLKNGGRMLHERRCWKDVEVRSKAMQSKHSRRWSVVVRLDWLMVDGR